MKKLAVACLLGTAIFVIQSCKKPGCTDPKAVNYNADAKTDDGSCVLPKPDPRLAVEGFYTTEDSAFTDDAFTNEQTYTLEVYFDPMDVEEDKIYLKGLWGSDETYYANYKNGAFVIPTQKVTDTYSVTGSGQFSGNKVIYETAGSSFKNKGVGLR